MGTGCASFLLSSYQYQHRMRCRTFLSVCTSLELWKKIDDCKVINLLKLHNRKLQYYYILFQRLSTNKIYTTTNTCAIITYGCNDTNDRSRKPIGGGGGGGGPIICSCFDILFLGFFNVKTKFIYIEVASGARAHS